MTIRLIDVQYTDIDCHIKKFNKDITAELETTLAVNVGMSETEENQFAVILEIGLANQHKTFEFKIKATAHFESSENITMDFADSPFARINAPAIAFPYIRAFISNFTLNIGYNPVMLPSFNFVKMAEEQKKEMHI